MEIRQEESFFSEDENMFYVMVEIANFRQISKLKAREISEISEQLEHFCTNRGGKMVREQSGYFLFAFHPQREKALHLVSDFLFLTVESLQKKEADLFGFNLLLEADEEPDASLVFGRMKALLFIAPRENRVWAGTQVRPLLEGTFPLSGSDELMEILGPPQKAAFEPLSFLELLELTGWTEALQSPLQRQLAPQEGVEAPGKVIRLKGAFFVEKLLVLRSVFHQVYGSHEDFPVIFPLQDSNDYLSQLLSQVDIGLLERLGDILPPKDAQRWKEESHWKLLLASHGAGEYPGDSCESDVAGALRFYYLGLIHYLRQLGLPPVFIFLSPQNYEETAVSILEEILSSLVAQEGLCVLLLEPAHREKEFLGRMSSIAWTFPALTRQRVEKELVKRGWNSRFDVPDDDVVKSCEDRGASLAHFFWGVQEGRLKTGSAGSEDPSWLLLQSLDSSHHKVYYAYLIGQSLLTEEKLIAFFQFLGEDPAVVLDKIKNLKDLGFILFGIRNLALRPEFQARLEEQLLLEGRELAGRLGQYLHNEWVDDRGFSEIVYEILNAHGHYSQALAVLTHYVTHKINRGQGDFLPLLRQKYWPKDLPREHKDAMLQLSAAFKLRFALNQRERKWDAEALKVFRRYFTETTEDNPHGEWLLQQGRFDLYRGDSSLGFLLLKRALILAQDSSDILLEIRADTEIGLNLLMKRRIDEGREYFEMAARRAEKTDYLYNQIVNNGLDAVCRFLLGQVTGAVKILDTLEPFLQRSGMQQWKTFLGFLRARIEFDWGSYAKAVASIEEAQIVARRYGLDEALTILEVWKARSKAYDGDYRSARSILESLSPSLERNYFLAEVAYFEKDLPNAVGLLKEGLTLKRETQPFTGERISWLSGWAFIEDKVLSLPGERGVLEHQVRAFLAFLDGQLQAGEGVIQRFQELLTYKSLLELDIVSPLYYFWYYLTIYDDDSQNEALRSTLLGRSLKDLQTRGSRIEDPQQRHDYLHRPLWNARFMSEAKRHKLV